VRSRPAHQLFIDGEFVDAADGATFETLNPATGAPLAAVARGGDADVARAVTSARRAFEGAWGATSLAERARTLRRIADAIVADADRLAMLETLDGGKPIRETKARVLYAATWFEFFADMAQKVRSGVVPTEPTHLNYTLRQPLGVVGAIIPWNYPISSCAVKVPAALAMGNTVVLKPAEQAPLVPLALAEICSDAGLPDGAFNVVTGLGPEAGRAIVEHPRVDAISFTGSTAVGRDIASRGGARLKPVMLELGGKSPNIVFADADLELAASSALFTFAQNQGQVCTAGSRLLIDKRVEEEFIARLIEKAEALRIGDPARPETQLGAIITAQQLARVEEYVELGRDGGSVLLTGGARPQVDGCENGFFYRPTIFGGVDNSSRIAQEEIFGPVLSVIPFSGEAEAVQLANDVLYGLAAGVWTSDLGRAHRMARAIEAGVVWVNTLHVLSPSSPLGGWNDSGLGVMGGIEQAESYTRAKSVWLNLSDAAPSF
jgi:acyl-CoA reductase-like NAD-dependent aldehyde dehydrogenase